MQKKKIAFFTNFFSVFVDIGNIFFAKEHLHLEFLTYLTFFLPLADLALVSDLKIMSSVITFVSAIQQLSRSGGMLRNATLSMFPSTIQ